ncbi:hypothetical protein HMI55_004685 [Coelomomyces lativittatus]|nr:hypothetical protein HMI55_004685 [Coelomomyces lativittatus]
MFTLNPLQMMSGKSTPQDPSLRAGNEFNSLPQLPTSDSMHKVPSTDFGSNTSLCAYVSENSEKVAEKGALTLTVIQATHLPAFHRSSGRADPFVKIKIVGANGKKLKFETQAIKDVLNPFWDFTSSFPIPITKGVPDPGEPLIARFIVMDNSKLTSTGLIGECQIDLWDVIFDLIQNKNYVLDPKGTGWAYLRNAFWMPLQLPLGSQVESIPRIQVHFGLLVPGTYLTVSHLVNPYPEGFQPCLEETMVKDTVTFPEGLSPSTLFGMNQRANSDVSDQTSDRKKFSLKMGFKK